MEKGCKHYQEYVKKYGLEIYREVDAVYFASITDDAKLKKALHCFCSKCGSYGMQIFACLHCKYFGCRGEHLNTHLHNQKHNLAMDLSHGALYCHACGTIYFLNRELEALENQMGQDFIPSAEEEKLLDPLEIVGLRGLMNLGATCYMNAVMQSLIASPIFREYFLFKQHECTVKSMEKCLLCELSNLFREFYSGLRTPLSLHRLLYLIWNQAKHFAGDGQQDAHEFFITTLDALHQHSVQFSAKTKGSKRLSLNSKKCNCIVDQIFSGMLQSNVVCQSCNGVSTTLDPFWDISLDLAKTDNDMAPKTLFDCLKQFTRAERLNCKYKCSSCKSEQECTKQFTLHTLPSILSFHLKRFKPYSHDYNKITTHISFPAELDMSPFMSMKNNVPGDFRYSLYALVNHKGSMHAGHYTSYVRPHNTWVRCNDHVVTASTIEEALQSEAYMLFYHKNDYQQQMNKSSTQDIKGKKVHLQVFLPQLI